ncbi:MAG: hypothetical protein JJU31_06615 [Wenzhouxiangella sp.]|nr:hypothetical protein [Wenzhouxiangella sp.]
MSFLGVGKKDRGGRQVRIEHRGRHLRASRTGGVALREQIRAGGLTLTANSRRGARVSLTPARNTQVAFQNSRFVLRGRYGQGPVKLNLSKSGASLSARMGLGTINLTNPGRSSAKLAGVQVRGQKAATINAVVALFQMLAIVIRVAIVGLVLVLVGALNLLIWLFETTKALLARLRFGLRQRARAARTRSLEGAAAHWVASNGDLLNELSPEASLVAMKRLLAQAAMNPKDGRPGGTRAISQVGPADDEEFQRLIDRLWQVHDPANTQDADSAELPVIGTAVLAIHYRNSAPSGDLTEAFYQLDEFTLEDPPRTIGQEMLLEDIADLFGLRLEVGADQGID